MNTKNKFDIRDLEQRFGTLTFGLFLKTFRQAEELSQAQYGKQLGLSRANLCDLEKGRKLPSATRAVQIAKKMGVPPELLLRLSIQDALRQAKLSFKVHLEVA